MRGWFACFVVFLVLLFGSSFVLGAEVVYKDDNLFMGSISMGEHVSVKGYDDCFLSLGDYLSVEADNSAGFRPEFRCVRRGDVVKIENSDKVHGATCSYVCYNDDPDDGGVDEKILVGFVSHRGAYIESGLDCVMTMSNFYVDRDGGHGKANFSCDYDRDTGKISSRVWDYTPTPTESDCGYVCIDPSFSGSLSTSLSSDVFYGDYGSGTKSVYVGKDYDCAAGTSYFWCECSRIKVEPDISLHKCGLENYYIDGRFTTGFDNGHCSHGDFSYLCMPRCTPTETCETEDICGRSFTDDCDNVVDCPPCPECRDGIDNDKDGFCDHKDSTACPEGSKVGDPHCESLNDDKEECEPDQTCDSENYDCGSFYDDCDVKQDCGICSKDGEECIDYKCVEVEKSELKCGDVFEKGDFVEFTVPVGDGDSDGDGSADLSVQSVMVGEELYTRDSGDLVDVPDDENDVYFLHSFDSAGSIPVVVEMEDSSKGVVYSEYRNLIVYDKDNSEPMYYVASCIDDPDGYFVASGSDPVKFNASSTKAIRHPKKPGAGGSKDYHVIDNEKLTFDWRFKSAVTGEEYFRCAGLAGEPCVKGAKGTKINFHRRFPVAGGNVASLTVSIPKSLIVELENA